LDLHSNGIGPSGAEALASQITSLLCLRALHLNSNNIGTAGAVALAAPLARMRELREISLGYNYTSPRGIQALTERLMSPRALAMDDSGSECSGFQRLLRLSLRCNELGEAGAQALADCLPALCALKTLDLHSTCLRSGGMLSITHFHWIEGKCPYFMKRNLHQERSESTRQC
jgi:Ran GTPase-activating protein (RanGAP) involved in mRNA processing and transport